MLGPWCRSQAGRRNRCWPATGTTTPSGAVPLLRYVEERWLPSKRIESTTRASYVCNLTKHFLPFFGKKPMHQITPSLVQDWVTKAAFDGLSARSVRK